MLQPPGLDAAGPPPPPHLSEEIREQLRIASCVIVGGTTVFIWDFLHNVANDYYMLFKLTFRPSVAAYMASRIATLVYVLGFSLFATYPLPDCNAAIKAFNSFFPLSSVLTALLFFFRVRAVYGGRLAVSCIFGVLWLCLLGGAITIPIGSDAMKVDETCIVTSLAPYLGANGVATTLYDTSVFLAISTRLLGNSRVQYTTTATRLKAFVGGGKLYAFSEALFRDGQKYYLITVLSNALMILMLYAPGIPPIYRGMLSIPNMALTNILACRVYRNVRFHYFSIPPLSIPVITNSGFAIGGGGATALSNGGSRRGGSGNGGVGTNPSQRSATFWPDIPRPPLDERDSDLVVSPRDREELLDGSSIAAPSQAD